MIRNTKSNLPMLNRFILFPALVLTSVVLNIFIDLPIIKALSGVVLLTVIPGVSLARVIRKFVKLDTISSFLLGCGLALNINAVLYLWMSYGLEKVSPLQLIIAIATYSLLLFFGAAFLSKNKAIHVFTFADAIPKTRIHRFLIFFLVIFAIGAFIRLANIGYSEYQGDEAGNCLVNSIELARGNVDVIFNPIAAIQQRPPIQILLPAVTFLLTDSLDETVIRLPFAFAGLITLWFMYLIGCTILKNEAAAVYIGLLVALNGLLIIFSRIVQYQSFVAMGTVLAVFFLYQFLNSEKAYNAKVFLVLSFVIFAFALLAHFESLVLLPVFIFAIAVRLRQKHKEGLGRILFYSIVTFGIITLSFYLPFVLKMSTEMVGAHISSRFDASLHFNLGLFWETCVAYCSLPYMMWITISSLLAVFCMFNKRFLIFIVWFLSYFIFYIIISKLPKTHIYTIVLPWLVFAGVGMDYLVDKLKGRIASHAILYKVAQFSLILAITITSVISGRYVYYKFSDYSGERHWTSKVYQYKFGTFGFPYRRGWKTVGYLFRTGQFEGSYYTNEKVKISAYYLKQDRAPKKPVWPLKRAKYFINVINPQSAKGNVKELAPQYRLIAQIYTRGKKTMDIYERGAKAKEVTRYTDETYEQRYNTLDRIRL